MNPNHVRRLKRLIKKSVETAVIDNMGTEGMEGADNARIAELNLETYIGWLDEIYKDRASGKTQA